MATVSIRGLDEKILARLKRQARREGSSLNSLVLRMLQGEPTAKASVLPPKTFDDLDALAGTWSSQQVRAFERDTAAFAKIDPGLWK